MLEELGRDILVDRVVLGELERNVEHGERVEAHPPRKVGQPERLGRRERLRRRLPRPRQHFAVQPIRALDLDAISS
jgi:hypothetical protein